MNLQYDGLFTIAVVQRIVSDMEDFNKTVMDGLDDFMKKNYPSPNFLLFDILHLKKLTYTQSSIKTFTK